MNIVSIPAVLLLSTSSVAFASAHLWDIQEVYTNSDGSVQFVEFFTTGTDEFFLGGVLLEFEIDGIPVRSFTFPSSLSGNTTADHTFLVATPNFEAVYGLTPDYIMPPNFLSAGIDGSLNFTVAPDRVSLGGLPSDGIRSLNALVFDDFPSSFEINLQATPRNFAGLEVTIPEPSTGFLAAAGTLGALVRRRR